MLLHGQGRRSREAGEQPFKNIFEADGTYYVLFVHATPTTHQVYQLYVGAGLAPDYAEKNVFLTRAIAHTSHFQFTDDRATWSQRWVRAYDPGTGILTVTIDMGFDTFKTEFEQAQRDFCQPASFCTLLAPLGPSSRPGRKGCQCNEDGALARICKDNDICAQWAGQDIDWPDGGAYGFGVTFPPNFVAADQDHRPSGAPAGCIRQNDPGCNAPVIRAKDDLLGACANTPIPPAQFCGG